MSPVGNRLFNRSIVRRAMLLICSSLLLWVPMAPAQASAGPPEADEARADVHRGDRNRTRYLVALAGPTAHRSAKTANIRGDLDRRRRR